MKQTIEIEVPEGKKAILIDNKIIYENIAPKLPKTWEEFCNIYPCKIWECYIYSGSNISYSGIYDREKRLSHKDKNILPPLKVAETHLALMQLHQLRDCYRQGWVPDWKNGKIKYSICHYDGKYRTIQTVERNHFLTFQSMELAEKFLKNFKDLIKQAGDLI